MLETQFLKPIVIVISRTKNTFINKQFRAKLIKCTFPGRSRLDLEIVCHECHTGKSHLAN